MLHIICNKCTTNVSAPLIPPSVVTFIETNLFRCSSKKGYHIQTLDSTQNNSKRHTKKNRKLIGENIKNRKNY